MTDTFRPGPRRPKPRLPSPASEHGFTIIEVLVATVILSVGILGTFGLLNTTTETSALTHQREGAVSLARQILEDAQTIPFDQLSRGSVKTDLQEMKGLEKATSTETAWHIVRGTSGTQAGTTYAVEVNECSIDSPKDGLAKELTSEEAEEYCEKHKGEEEWKTGDTVDTTPIDFKRVTVKVSWTATNRSPYVEQATLLSAAGESTALNASELKLVPPPTPSCESGQKSGEACVTQPTITENVSELTFSVCAPKTASVLWSLEGVLQSSSSTASTTTTCKSGEGYVWKFKWKIEGLSDGTYQVSAQATTTKGVLGPPVTIPVRLIRGEPAAPKGVKGGFNEVYEGGVAKKAIELEWEANSERNVIGYRVYNPSKQLVCPTSASTLSTSLSCVEVPRQYEPASHPIYTIVALYRNGKEEVTESKAKASFELGSPETPYPPTNLKCEGNSTLTWQAPTTGPSVAFYRIYRDSTSYTSRYDTASSTATSYEDADPGDSTHKYWVTAVSQTLTESTFAGAVEC